ncbi:hypothetical protein OROGR_022364 [Orobanche gracilis]
MRVFQSAIRLGAPKNVHLEIVGVYERAVERQRLNQGAPTFADEALKEITKKFSRSCQVWLRRLQSLLKQKHDGTSVIMSDVLSLPKKQHSKFISSAAILQFENGVQIRGESYLKHF